MHNPILKVNNLGKKYTISHKSTGNSFYEGYPSLQEQITNSVRWVKHKTASYQGRKRSSIPSSEEFWALKDVSFEVAEGERVGIIGWNGAGKSTLLKLLSRITEPTTGEIILDGKVASLLEIGTGFHPELTGRENIYLNGAILGMTRGEIKRKFDEIVAFSGVEQFLDTPVKRYSSGMYVRLAFAVAAHLEPDILIVDEVLAVGDIQFQKKCLGKMEEISEKEGRTILFVSHNMDTVQKLCSRCILLEKGQIVLDGSITSAIRHYLSVSLNNAIPNQWIDLAKTKRQGTGEVWFNRIKYSSLNPTISYVPYADGPLEFLLEIESTISISIESLAVAIQSQEGNLLVNADILEFAQVIKLEIGTNLIRLKMKKLSLKAGTYVISLWVDRTGKGAMEEKALDYVESAFEIEVIDNNPNAVVDEVQGYVTCQFDISKVN